MSADRMRPPRSHHARHALTRLGRALEAAATEVCSTGHDVLDFGCGDKPYADLFLQRGANYIGADLPVNADAQLLITPEGRLPLADASVDAVLSTQVLEHVPDPAAYLLEARRVLRANGNLILSTHGVWSFHPHPDDFWRWTGPGLRRLMNESGFEVTRIVGVMNSASAGMQLVQDNLLGWLPRWLHTPVIFGMQPLVALLDRFGTAEARSRDAAIFVVTARSQAHG
jgi:SAM-dependent methyltransferase